MMPMITMMPPPAIPPPGIGMPPKPPPLPPPWPRASRTFLPEPGRESLTG